MFILLFFAGLIVGCLLNSLADSLPPDELGVRHRPGLPRCRYCATTHRPPYWLAVAGFLFQSGRCEHCHGPRRLRAAWVEVGTGLALIYLWQWAGGDWAKFLAAALIVAIFILIAVIDLEHRLILWSVIWPSAALVALVGILTPGRGPVKTLVGGAVGYGLVLGVFVLAQVFSIVITRVRGQPLEEVAFGGGDVNLALVIGLAVGWSGIVFALLIAIFAAGTFSLGYLAVQLLRGRYNVFTPIPYGPFLIFGALTIYLYGQELVSLWYPGR